MLRPPDRVGGAQVRGSGLGTKEGVASGEEVGPSPRLHRDRLRQGLAPRGGGAGAREVGGEEWIGATARGAR